MPKPRAALYCRVSTIAQKDKDSLPTQEKRLRDYCAAQGFDVSQVFVDAGISGKDTNRPQFQAMMSDCKAGLIDVVLVTDLSRISRSVADTDRLVKFFLTKDIRFISLRENLDFSTVFGRGIANLLTSLNQIEREQAGERTGIVKAQRAKEGRFNGGNVPFGYTSRGALARKLMRSGVPEAEAMHEAVQKCPEKGRLYMVEEEAEIVRRIYMTFLETNSLARARDALNKAGITTGTGKKWSREGISRILKNPVYLGMIVTNKRVTGPDGKEHHAPRKDWILTGGMHEAIITQAQFEEVERTLKQNTKPRRTGRIYLFSGLLRCGYCGAAMVGGARVRSNKKAGKHAYYKCSGRLQYGPDECQGVTWRADELEKLVIDHLKGLSQDGDFMAKTESNFQEIRNLLNVSDVAPEVKRLEKAIRKYRQRLETLLDALQDELIQKDDFQQRYGLLKEELTTLEAQKAQLIDQHSRQNANFERMQESFQEILNFWQGWEELTDEGKQRRLQTIVEEVRATKEHIDIDLIVEGKVLSHLYSGDPAAP